MIHTFKPRSNEVEVLTSCLQQLFRNDIRGDISCQGHSTIRNSLSPNCRSRLTRSGEATDETISVSSSTSLTPKPTSVTSARQNGHVDLLTTNP